MPTYIRIYRCPDCGHKWKSRSTRSEYETDCPSCARHFDPLPERITAPAIVCTKARAVDEAYRVVSEDYGLTDLRDNAKEGETSVVMPTMDSGMKEMVEAMSTVQPTNKVQQKGGFMWGGAPSAGPIQFAGKDGAIGAARVGAAMANMDNRNPMKMLHRARPKLIPTPLNKTGR